MKWACTFRINWMTCNRFFFVSLSFRAWGKWRNWQMNKIRFHLPTARPNGACVWLLPETVIAHLWFDDSSVCPDSSAWNSLLPEYLRKANTPDNKWRSARSCHYANFRIAYMCSICSHPLVERQQNSHSASVSAVNWQNSARPHHVDPISRHFLWWSDRLAIC